MDAQQLLSDYNYYRNFTAYVHEMRAKGIPVHSAVMKPKGKPSRAPQLESMLAFCEEHRLDPKLWLYMLFKMRHWKAAPLFNQLVPKNKKTLDKNLNHYSNLSEVPLFKKRVSQQSHQQGVLEGAVFDRNRDIDGTTESLKRRYLNEGDSVRCMDEMEIRTNGYHPRSLVCARCPSSTQCEQTLRAKMPFDIVALRRGDISVQQAQQLAYRHGS